MYKSIHYLTVFVTLTSFSGADLFAGCPSRCRRSSSGSSSGYYSPVYKVKSSNNSNSSQCANGRCPITPQAKPAVQKVEAQTLQIAAKPAPTMNQPLHDFESLSSLLEESGRSTSQSLSPGQVGSFTVYIVNPLTGQEVESKKFSRQDQADQFREFLQSHYWLVYRANGKRDCQEVRSIAEFEQKVAALEKKGYEIEGYPQVLARVKDDHAISLKSLLSVDSSATPAVEPSSSSNRLPAKPEPNADALLGVWKAVTRTPDGELGTIEFKLDAGGWAKIKVPSANGGSTEITRRAVIEDQALKLRDGDTESLLGKLAKVSSDEFVLAFDKGQVTFVKQ